MFWTVEVVVWSTSHVGFVFMCALLGGREGRGGYLGLLFNNCLLLLGFCCMFELYGQDITTTVGAKTFKRSLDA